MLRGRKLWLGGVMAVGLLAAACGLDASAGGGDSLSLGIGSPTDGESVSNPFTVTFDSNVPLDDPSTGEHHVHLGFDGADLDVESEYSLVYDDTFEVSGLSPGEHTIHASLRNADHSDAGPSDEITVIVGNGGGSGSGETTDSEGDRGGGFDY